MALNEHRFFPSCTGLLRLFGVWAAALLLGASHGVAAEKPNIVFILFDDLGYGQPPCYRAGSEFKTPNLDKLASEGMRFTDAHSASSVCTPTRYGIMTGRYPWRIGQFGVLRHYSPPIIEKERLTLASMLQTQGYDTACFGKWHLGMKIGHEGKREQAAVGTLVAEGPVTRGFKEFCGYTEARSIKTIIENGRVAAEYQPVEVQPLLAKKAVEYIDERAHAPATGPRQPFFLYVPLSTPHLPVVPAAEFVGKSGTNEYGDWILEGDAVVGKILAALEQNQLSANTLVLVSSDNGADGRVYAPLRGSKTTIWEGGHREPLVARWPGMIKPGSVCDDTICLNDLLATSAEITGAKLADDTAEDSVSFLPDLLGTAKGPVREATVHQSAGGDLAIRQGSWKLVFLRGGKRELYNLKQDFGETTDMAAAQPAIVARLAKLMQQYIDRGRSTPGAAQRNEATILLDGTNRGGKKNKGQKKQAKEMALARDPSFD